MYIECGESSSILPLPRQFHRVTSEKSISMKSYCIVHAFCGIGWSYHISAACFLRMPKMTSCRLLAHGPERALSGEHHGGSAGPQPGVIVRSISTDNATDGHEQTVVSVHLASEDIS